MRLRRWTPLVFCFPNRYVDRDPSWEDFDLAPWSATKYEWTADSWNGLRDFARPPAETVAAGCGDCEDYALVAVAWAIAHDRPGVGLAFCWKSPYPWPTHVVAFDDDRVYSSGRITTGPIEDWLADSRYVCAVDRRVT